MILGFLRLKKRVGICAQYIEDLEVFWKSGWKLWIKHKPLQYLFWDGKTLPLIFSKVFWAFTQYLGFGPPRNWTQHTRTNSNHLPLPPKKAYTKCASSKEIQIGMAQTKSSQKIIGRRQNMSKTTERSPRVVYLWGKSKRNQRPKHLFYSSHQRQGDSTKA